MSCEGKVFVSSHNVIKFTIKSGFDNADVQSLTAQLSLRDIVISKSTTGGGITEVSGEYFMEIEPNELTVNGTYDLEISIIDTNGDLKRICPTPNTVEFIK